MKTLIALATALLFNLCAQAQPKVYFTKEISPEALVRIYKALGKEAKGRVAVKISTGEAGGNNYLKPTLIRNLVDEVGGTIVECNTAYAGSRNTSEAHWKRYTSTASTRSLPSTSWTNTATLGFR